MARKIGFIGTGVMGTGMIKNLLKAGFPVTVYNRTKEHAKAAIAAGATWLDSPAEVAQATEVVITIVGFPKDVDQVYFGKDGVFEGIHSQQTLIDMTTTRPDIAQRIYATAKDRHITALDAPVSGGDLGAKNGNLTIMVGGDQADFEANQDIFAAMGSNINYFGPAGSGQHVKMANQIMVAGTMTGMVEMFVYAKQAGLDLEAVMNTVGSGAAANWSLSNYGPRILKNDYTPGFFAKHFLKDLRIALDSADDMKIQLPATEQAAELYRVLVEDKKLGNDGTQALIKLWWH